jgi:hypothetical protein
MKTSTAYQISFANAFADLYLDKENGEVALDLRRQETTVYLNQIQYQALVLLVQQSLEDEEFVEFLSWQKDPLACDESRVFEICGPEHMVCMACTPCYERVKLTFEIGVALDLSFADYEGLSTLLKEAQADLEWRRELLRWNMPDANDGFAADGTE